MGVDAVGHLIAHAGCERERPAVLQLGGELAVDAENYVALFAPVVGDVAGCERRLRAAEIRAGRG